jgi:rifamycin polyketide synthase module 1/2/3
LIHENNFTILPGVPTMFHYLLESARERTQFHSLNDIRLGLSAGAILPAKLNQEFEEILE